MEDELIPGPTGRSPALLVLTPLKDAARYLDGYVGRIEKLAWPRDRLSIGLLESDSVDGTFECALALKSRLETRCARVTLVKRDYGFRLPPAVPRWAPAYQLARRSILARARNQLLFRALADEEWVLWIDVDVVEFPADIVQQLLTIERDIVHPHCVSVQGGPTFDLNAWSHGGTKIMSDLRGKGPVRLDAVGGTMLLVRADHHRDGLIFPPFPYGRLSSRIRERHPLWRSGEVETEGFGILAADMGLQCWGLPDLEIVHGGER